MNYPLTALISDLHANLPALETALADARVRGAERFVCLGDVIGYGARPRECLEWVMRLCVEDPVDPGAAQARTLYPGLCLMGNHEAALLGSGVDFNDKARAAIDWTREELNRSDAREQNAAFWDYLGALVPAMCDGVAMFAHGSPRDPVREYMLPRDSRNPEKLKACFAAMERRVCFVGHSHVPAVYLESGELFRPKGPDTEFDLGDEDAPRAIVNVGSVGQPRDGDPRLSYGLFDGRRIRFVRLEYDHAAAAAAIRAVPALPEFLAERLAVGR
ncbi:MAG: metallophosphoesterase family protein [Planctomycetes bacterium]|nr:metallophosphoesterase family protein [Planctomycetota bacterium]